MKKVLIIATLLISASAFAGEDTGQTVHVQPPVQTVDAPRASVVATSGSVAGASNQIGCLINCADQTNAAAISAQAARDVANTTTTAVVKNTPSVSGPNLVTSNDTCMGSTSGSVNIAGLGIGGGTSWVDTNCKMLKNSREMWNMGMKAAALALMCTDSANKEALELTGFICPQTEKANADAKKVSEAKPEQYTDPIVRARLGLPALVASAK